MEDVFWADKLATMIINRKTYNHINKKITPQFPLTIKSSTSISGVPHIGNASDVLRHDALVRALKDKGIKVRFIWVAEDMDALRKVPAGLPKTLEKYLGMPVADIPCPHGCCKSYSEHFSKLFIESLRHYFGTDPDYLSTAKTYRNGEFVPYIKKTFEKLELVKQIWNKSRSEPLPKDWTPWIQVCENCGKIITTKVYIKDGEIKYSCEDYAFRKYGEEAYTILKGCGYKGLCDFKNGKLLWRVEWGMLWAHWKVVLEGAGKEHFMPSGSFWTAGEVTEKIFDWPEPYPGDNPLQPYEYLTFEGKKMSASLGNVVATWEWPEFAPPQILRLLFLKKMRKVRDLSFKMMPNYVDEFDKLQRIYFEKEFVDNKKEEMHLKRLYEMIEVNIPEKLPVQIPFSVCAIISQISNKPIETIQKLYPEINITSFDEKYILERIKIAKGWVERFANEYKITLNKEPPELELSDNDINAIKNVIKLLKSDISEKQFELELYKISKYNTKHFFKFMYKILINKDHGPRLAPFLLTVKEKALDLFIQTLSKKE